MRLVILLGLGILVSGCEHGNTFNRGYVISKSVVEPEIDLQAQPEAQTLIE